MISGYSYIKKHRKQRKLDLLRCLGNKCAKCGYDKCSEALDFHHINPDDKDFGISQTIIKDFNKAYEEIKKCVILCANCHRELHAKLWSLDEIDIPVFIDIISEKAENKKTKCLFCHNKFLPDKKCSRYCSIECAANGRRKANRPPKEELQLLITNNTFVNIGKMYGVTDNAIKKWAKKYGLLHRRKDIKKAK